MQQTTDQNVLTQWDKVIEKNRSVFFKKNADYGPSWLVLRPKSLTDQIFIKVKRIYTLQEVKVQKVAAVGDDIPSEFAGIINYSIIGLMKIKLAAKEDKRKDIPTDEITPYFEEAVSDIQKSFITNKLPVIETIRGFRSSTITDLIFENILRLKYTEEAGTVFEKGDPETYYLECANYAIIALLRIQEEAVE